MPLEGVTGVSRQVGGGTVTGIDAKVGMAEKGLDTEGKAAGFELRARTRQEAFKLHFAQN